MLAKFLQKYFAAIDRTTIWYHVIKTRVGLKVAEITRFLKYF